jgi:hypothetical protein
MIDVKRKGISNGQSHGVNLTGNELLFGDGQNSVKTLTANTGLTNRPKIRFNTGLNSWEYSNNGTDFLSFTSVQYASEAIAGIVKFSTAQLATQGSTIDTAMTPLHVRTVVNAAITSLVNSSPAALDTLSELAAALGSDPNFATTITNLIGQKLNSSDVVDNLTTAAPQKALSANQGVVIKGVLDALTQALASKADLVAGKVPFSQLPDKILTVDSAGTGDLLGSLFSNLQLKAKAVTDAKLSSDLFLDINRAVGTNHVKEQAITTPKIADESVTNAKQGKMPGLTAKSNVNSSASIPQDVPLLNIWEGIQSQYWDDERGLSRWGKGTLFKQMTSKTLASSTVETSLIDVTNQVGTVINPEGAFYVGDCWTVIARGILSCANGTDTLTIRVKLGAIVIATTGDINSSGPFTDKAYKLEVAFTVRSLTATGAVIAGGHFTMNGMSHPLSNVGLTTINFNASQTIDITAQWSTASASNAITQQQMEVAIN